MSLALTGWDLAGVLAKLAWYLGAAIVGGGTFCLWLIPDSSRRFLRHFLAYVLLGGLLGFHAVILYFLVQVASGAGSVAGILDWPMVRFYLGTGAGETSLFRMGIFLILVVGELLALAHLAKRDKPPTRQFYRLVFRFNFACFLFLCLSFQATGHVATLELPARLALAVHVACVGIWIGSLYPLWWSTGKYAADELKSLFERFSRWALPLVGLLLAAAAVLLFELLASPADLLGSRYGLSLLLKSLLVAGLLALAALNRWRLVPSLHSAGGVGRLRYSVCAELVLAGLVLLLTGYLSTVIGPPHM